MRMRNKPWAKPVIENCNYFIKDPFAPKGKWRSLFIKDQPLHLELGCGKGTFMAKLAHENPNINYLAIDMKSIILACAIKNIDQEFGTDNSSVSNVLLTPYDIERILNILDQNDFVDRIYINFCNPWPKEKQNKKRLTHSRQLENYKTFLPVGKDIYFKTDDDGLFEDTLGYMAESGFEVTYKTYDLHSSDYSGNIDTEHEKFFTEQGIKIKFLIAKRIK